MGRTDGRRGALPQFTAGLQELKKLASPSGWLWSSNLMHPLLLGRSLYTLITQLLDSSAMSRGKEALEASEHPCWRTGRCP